MKRRTRLKKPLIKLTFKHELSTTPAPLMVLAPTKNATTRGRQ